jgi:hypothetical protein
VKLLRLRARRILPMTATIVPQCAAITVRGKRCSFSAADGSPYCMLHKSAGQPPAALA